MSDKLYLTQHSKVRAAQRFSADNVLTEAKAKKAFKYGKEFTYFIGKLYNYLKEKQDIKHNGHVILKVFDDYVWIFQNGYGHRLVTVYKLPEEFLPVDDFIDSERNPAIITLTNKKTGLTYYWGTEGMVPGLYDETIIDFTSRVKAKNYIANNAELQRLAENYELGLI